jgi:thiamine pyrophosphokinase
MNHTLQSQYEVLVLGGLSGRLDQTVHLLHYFHKSRRTRPRMFVVTDDCVGWVLDEVITIPSHCYACLTSTFSLQGEHLIHVDHSCFGPTCGLLPIGVESTVLSTTGLRWNLSKPSPSYDAS